ncbi:hypothetical protein [uncultured Endozoicomonas sp.]|uniref:hypothetical protein n=1 Tax=uncultured Endozoicomonas sp. TaxID=432652 RepID=UPI0026285F04|nr:hypothetical protein [uncultured Endozoicomonas sp.]
MYKKWLITLPCMILLAVALNTGWNLIQSEIWRSQTVDFLDFWAAETKDDPGFAVDKQQWLITLAGADNALDKMPNSPELMEMRARVLNWGVQKGWAISETEEPMELAAWQQSILQRPAWPYSWSSYAQARSQRSLIDKQFEAALFRADQLGPWEQAVMENATILGRYYRGWLSEPLQLTLDNSQQRLAKLYPHRVRWIEKQYPLP